MQLNRGIYRGLDPIETYRKLMSGFKGDPGFILQMAQLEVEDDEVGPYRQRVEEVAAKVFPTNGTTPEGRFLEFMDWVAVERDRAQPLADLLATYPGVSLGLDYQDLCGLWFNRDRVRYRSLWAHHRALYLSRYGLPLPFAAYEAITGTPEEAFEVAYDEQTDQFDRQVVGGR